MNQEQKELLSKLQWQIAFLISGSMTGYKVSVGQLMDLSDLVTKIQQIDDKLSDNNYERVSLAEGE